MIHCTPNPKINLGLFIKGKRADGYHLLETVMYPLAQPLDKLSLEESRGGLELEMGGIPIEGDLESNLCIKAYRQLKKLYPDLPAVRICLEKNIPAGAGLGGGSSDAAHTLLLLNSLFSLSLSPHQLAEIAKPLGADVPFFVYNKPMLATGIGTELEEIEIEMPYRIELVTPPIHVSTIAAYKALDYTMFDTQRDLKEILSLPIDTWEKYLENDLEVPVFHMFPALKQIKADLYAQGAVYAAMSGSGSAIFGLFPQ